LIVTFKYPGWHLNFSAWFKKALWLFEEKNIKLLNKWRFVENKTASTFWCRT
jgi:hypothetical protein